MGRYLKPPATTPLNTASATPMNAPGASHLPARPATKLQRAGSVTNDAGYWRGKGLPIPHQITPSSFVPPLRPPVPAVLKDTPHGQYYPELSVASQLPPWQEATFWSKPLEDTFTCTAVAWYASWSTVQTIEVENNWMYKITGFCFEWSNIPIGDVFEFQIWAGGVVLSTFQSMRISAVANPAFQYAIGGPQRPIPVYGVVDQNKSIQIRVRNLGPQSTAGTFSKVNSDAFGSAITTTLIGWKSPLVANKDGGPLPGDVFPITDDVPFEPRYDLDATRADRGKSTRSV